MGKDKHDIILATDRFYKSELIASIIVGISVGIVICIVLYNAGIIK